MRKIERNKLRAKYYGKLAIETVTVVAFLLTLILIVMMVFGSCTVQHNATSTSRGIMIIDYRDTIYINSDQSLDIIKSWR